MVEDNIEHIAAELSPEQRTTFMDVLASRSSIIRDGFSFWGGIKRSG